jgi:hypothetical protein
MPIKKKRSSASNLGQPKLGEFHRARTIFFLPFVVNGKLFARVYTIALVFHEFVPQSRSLLVLAPAFRQRC